MITTTINTRVPTNLSPTRTDVHDHDLLVALRSLRGNRDAPRRRPGHEETAHFGLEMFLAVLASHDYAGHPTEKMCPN